MSIEGREIKMFIGGKEVKGIKSFSLLSSSKEMSEALNKCSEACRRFGKSLHKIKGELKIGFTPKGYWLIKNQLFLNENKMPRGFKGR